MANDNPEVKIELTADTRGGEQAEGTLKKVGQTSQKTAREVSSSFRNIEQSFSRVTKAANLFRRALTGFGIAGVVTGIVASISTIIESFQSAKKEAEAFDKSLEEQKVKKAVDDLKTSYDALTASINNVTAAKRAKKELDDLDIKATRDLEDAGLDLAEQRELAAIDPNDPLAAEKRAEIQAKYKAGRDSSAVSRRIGDAERERRDLAGGAAQDRADAASIYSSAASTRAQIEEAKKRRYAALLKSTTMNGEDDDGSYFSQAKNSIGKIFTLQWGRLGDYRTDKGNAIRKDAEADAQKEQALIDQLEKTHKSQIAEAEKKLKEADQKEQRGDTLGKQIEALQLKGQAVELSGSASMKAASDATGKKQAKIADAEAALSAVQIEKTEYEQRKAEAEERKKAANEAVYAAQGDFDLAKANNDRKGMASAQAKLTEAKRNASVVNIETDALINSMNELLKNLSHELHEASSYLAKQRGQERYAWSEAPGGL